MPSSASHPAASRRPRRRCARTCSTAFVAAARSSRSSPTTHGLRTARRSTNPLFSLKSRERWLATHGGEYGSDQTGLICLANAAARQWLLDQLVALIDDVQPDYLKWDNNIWVNCDRDGHGHGSSDGNFAHVRGL